MYLPNPKSINLYESLNKNVWLTTDILLSILTKSKILDNLNDENKALLLKYDLISIFLVETNIKEVSLLNFKAAIVDDLSHLLHNILTHYRNLQFSQLDVQLGLLNILRFLKGQDTLDINQISNLQIFLQQKFSSVNIIEIFENIYELSLVENNLDSLPSDLRKLTILVKESVNVEFLNNYYYLWLFYKAYINAPKELFAHVDELSAIGRINIPSIDSLEEQLITLQNEFKDFDNPEFIENYFNIIFEKPINIERLKTICKSITMLHPSNLESVYNFTQIAKLLEDDSIEYTELYQDGEIYEITSEVLNQIPDIDLLIDYIETLQEEPFDFEIIEELMNFIIDMLGVIDTTYANDNETEDSKESIKKVLTKIFIDLCLIFEKHELNIFERKDSLSIFEFIYKIDDLFIPIYISFSGDFKEIITETTLDYQKIATEIKNNRELRINILNKFKQNPEYSKFIINKRKDFYLSIVNRKSKLPVTNDQFNNRLIARLNRLNINIQKELLEDPLTIQTTLENVAKLVLPLYFKYMAENEGVNEEITENVNQTLSMLVKLGLKVEVNQGNQLGISFSSKQLQDYLNGYNNSEVIDGEYTMENLLAFGMQQF